MTASRLVHIRRPEGLTELNFVRSSWTASELDQSGKALKPGYMSGIVLKRLAYWGHGRLVDKLMNRSSILVADSLDAPGVLCGYVVYETRGDTSILHYLYVGFPFRRNGIAKLLAGELQSSVTYTTRTAVISAIKLPPHWVFDDNQRWK